MKTALVKSAGGNRKSMKCPPRASRTCSREKKSERFTARVSPLVASAKGDGYSWSAWISFLTDNYRRSNYRSPMIDPCARRLLVWSARSLDEIAAAVTGSVASGGTERDHHVRRAVNALAVIDEIGRVRAQLESWIPQPVSPKGGQDHGHL